MKRNLLLVLFICSYTLLFAQPANDDCSGLIDLGVAPICPSGIFTNVDATASDIGGDNIPGCFNGGIVDRDVWFQFTTDGMITDYTITVNGVADGMGSTPMLNPQIEIYRGETCGFEELAALEVCASANNGDDFVITTVFDLDPNTVYYVRVNDYSATATPNSGTFEFCITEYVPEVNICDATSSTACSGTLFDCGGPDMDYGNSENFTYTICPNEFNECILIDIINFNIENNFDFLNIYAGDNITAPILASLTGAGGGNDFEIQTSSSCITFQFTSDGSVSAPGFELEWQCVSFPCSGSSENTPEVITSIPFTDDESTCGEASTIGTTICGDDQFLQGPDYFYTFESPGDICTSIEIVNADFGTNFVVLDGPPSDPNSNCVAVGQAGSLASVNFEDPGTYYIIVANGAGCTDFQINMEEADCNLSPALVDALCNPVNGCQEFDTDGMSLPSIFNLDIGFEDIPIVDGQNQGCYLGTGAGNFYWFTMQAQQDGPFGFIVDGANFQSDIDFSVWGPFNEMEVCETPDEVINFIETNQPIRSSWSGGAGPTGLVDIHPITGDPVTDPFDCGDPSTPGAGGDDFVSTIQVQEGEVYVILINDWGGQITDGIVSVDFGPSQPEVLEPVPIVIIGNDTTICIGDTASLVIDVANSDIDWLTNTASLTCDNCPNPQAFPSETTTYQVAVTGICTADTFDLTVFVFDVDAGPDFTVCQGEEVQIISGTEYPNATYQWTGTNLGDLSCTDCPQPVFTANSAGTFTYTVTLDGPGCVLTDDVTITVLPNPAPSYDVVADSVFLCLGSSTDLGLSSNQTTDVMYTWTSQPPGFNSSSPNPNINPTQTATYFVEVTSMACPVSSFDSVYVQVDELPILDVASDTLVCQGELVSLGSTMPQAGVNYQWLPEDGLDDPNSANPIATISNTTTYTLSATIGACVQTESVTVTSTVIDIQILSPQSDSIVICKGETVDLSASASPSGITVNWTPTDGSIDPTTGLNVTLSPETATLYVASVNVPGCTRFDSIYVDVDSIPFNMAIDPADTTVCAGSLVLLQSPVYEPADFMGITHQWLPTAGLQSPDTLYNVVIQANETLDYIRTTTLGVCTQMDTATITIDPTADIFISPSDTTICTGETVQLVASSPDITEFTWMPEDGSLSCLECPNPIASVSGSGSFTFTAMGEFEGCPTEASATINVLTEPAQGVIGDTDICFGESITLNNNPSVDPNVMYIWNADPADPSLDDDAAAPSVSPTQTTTYMVTIDNGVCDPYQDEVTIFVLNDPQITVDADAIICEGESITLNAFSTEEGGTFTWLPGGQTGSTITVEPEFSTDYTVTYSYPCGDDIVNVVGVTVLENVSVGISPSDMDTVLFEGQELTVLAVTDPMVPGATYTWNTEQTGASIETVANPNAATYSVTVTTPEGCTSSATLTYEIMEAMYDIPNAFTPDGDGENDNFNVVSEGLVEVLEFKIYTRWGEIVYDNENPTNGWDGTKDGEPLPTDVYFYKIMVQTTSQSETFEGDVTLIR